MLSTSWALDAQGMPMKNQTQMRVLGDSTGIGELLAREARRAKANANDW